MKMLSFYFAIVFLVGIYFMSCKKTESPDDDDITEFCTKGVVCYTVQGEAFVSDTPVLGTHGQALSGTQAQLNKSTYSAFTLVSLEIIGYDAFKNTTLSLAIRFPAMHDSTYLFSESDIKVAITRPEKQIQNMTLWCDEYNAKGTNGYIAITAIDTAAKFVSGTFNVPITCYSRDDSGSLIYYEDQMLIGHFDSVSLIKTGGPW